MDCSFKEEITYPNGSFQRSMCLNRADILIANDPCYGLCYACAYGKLQAENKQLKEALKYAKTEILTFALQVEDTSESGFALAEGINNKIDELTSPER